MPPVHGPAPVVRQYYMKTKQTLAGAIALALSSWPLLAQDNPRPEPPPGLPPAGGAPRDSGPRREGGDRPDGAARPEGRGERRPNRPEGGQPGQPGQPGRPAAGVFQLLDANGDGAIDATELSEGLKR